MSDTVDIHIGRRIRERRLAQDLTQLQLAEATGVPFRQLSLYELGKNRPFAATLWNIAEALNVSINYFYAGLLREPDESNGYGNGIAADEALACEGVQSLLHSYYGLDEQPRRQLLELAKAMVHNS